MKNKPRLSVSEVVQGVFSGKYKLSQAAELLLPGNVDRSANRDIDKSGETFKQVQDTVEAMKIDNKHS